MVPEPVTALEPAPPVLELRGLRAGYGRIEVLRGVDLVVPPGAIIGLLGPNGAGKTTTLAAISGQLSTTGGTVQMMGVDVTGARPEALARAGVCTIPEGRGVFPNLTVDENLWMHTYGAAASEGRADRSALSREAAQGRHRPVWSPRRKARLLGHVREVAFGYFPLLAERRYVLAGHLSGGEQQMLSLARALATDPALLLLDELSMGLAPLVVEELYGQVAQLTSRGVSILVVEQFAGAVLEVADQVALMINGEIRAAGPPADMADQLQAAYLGAA